MRKRFVVTIASAAIITFFTLNYSTLNSLIPIDLLEGRFSSILNLNLMMMQISEYFLTTLVIVVCSLLLLNLTLSIILLLRKIKRKINEKPPVDKTVEKESVSNEEPSQINLKLDRLEKSIEELKQTVKELSKPIRTCARALISDCLFLERLI